MIRLARGPEPALLAPIREAELKRVGDIAALRAPTSDEIGGRYSKVRSELYWRQFSKCCFCEHKSQQPYNDVEHYRPKAGADRSPGSIERHGYWWLAWTWENLLFSCAACNRSHKRTRFPLKVGSLPLVANEPPPGGEEPLLIDPFAEDPIEHIQFRLSSVNSRARWMPFPRQGSEKGRWTINITGLDHPRLFDLYNDHVDLHVMPRIEVIRSALAGGDSPTIRETWGCETKRLLVAGMPFAALTHDALDHYVPEATRARFDLVLNRPIG